MNAVGLHALYGADLAKCTVLIVGVSLVAWSQVNAVEVPLWAVITVADTQTRREDNVLLSPIIELAVTLTWSWLREGAEQHSLTQRCARGGDVSVGTGCTSI